MKIPKHHVIPCACDKFKRIMKHHFYSQKQRSYNSRNFRGVNNCSLTTHQTNSFSNSLKKTWHRFPPNILLTGTKTNLHDFPRITSPQLMKEKTSKRKLLLQYLRPNQGKSNPTQTSPSKFQY